MEKRLLAVGDIHGHYDKLLDLMARVKFNAEEDFIIFLGDYVDRGPQSLEVLEYIYELKCKAPYRVVTLLGNHEHMMLNYLTYQGIETADLDDIWIYNGGNQTLPQLQKLYQEDREHYEEMMQFVRDMPLRYYREKEALFVHAGFDPSHSMEAALQLSDANELLWIREKFFDHYRGDVLCVIGHTPIQYIDAPLQCMVPQILHENVLLCDTGSYIPGGQISCVDVKSALAGAIHFWQSA